MADYTTNLKVWGAAGTEFPDNYSYLEDEAPVDDWDNFLNSNVISDLQHLVSVTNERIESDKGTDTGFPASPEDSHLYHDETNNELSYWEAASSSWHRLLKADGDTLSGALDFSENAAQNVGPLTMAAAADLAGNDLVDGAKTIYDSVNGYIPLSALQESSVTVTAGNGLTGGGNISLGGSTTIDLNEGAGSGIDADKLDGNEGIHYLLDVQEDGAAAVSDVTAIDFTGHLNVIDDGDGTITLDPAHTHDDRYVNVSGDSMTGSLSIATGQSIEDGSGNSRLRFRSNDTIVDDENGNLGVQLQGGSYYRYFAQSDSPLQIQDGEGGFTAVQYTTSASAPGTLELPNAELYELGDRVATRTWASGNNINHSDLADAPSGSHHSRYTDTEAQGAIDGSNHNHDSRYYQPDGNDEFVAEVRTSDPTSPKDGQMWLRSDL